MRPESVQHLLYLSNIKVKPVESYISSDILKDVEDIFENNKDTSFSVKKLAEILEISKTPITRACLILIERKKIYVNGCRPKLFKFYNEEGE